MKSAGYVSNKRDDKEHIMNHKVLVVDNDYSS